MFAYKNYLHYLELEEMDKKRAEIISKVDNARLNSPDKKRKSVSNLRLENTCKTISSHQLSRCSSTNNISKLRESQFGIEPIRELDSILDRFII